MPSTLFPRLIAHALNRRAARKSIGRQLDAASRIGDHDIIRHGECGISATAGRQRQQPGRAHTHSEVAPSLPSPPATEELRTLLLAARPALQRAETRALDRSVPVGTAAAIKSIDTALPSAAAADLPH